MIMFGTHRFITTLSLLCLASCTLPSGKVLESYDACSIPTFSPPDHHTLERTENGCRIISHYYHGDGGYGPKKYPWTTSKRISIKDWDKLVSILGRGGFWTSEVHDCNRPIPDGTALSVKARKGDETKTVRQNGQYSPCILRFFKELDAY